MNKFYLYIYFHPVTGLPCYVGKGSDWRWRRQRGTQRRRHNPHLANIIAKYGECPCVVIRSGLAEQEAFDMEIAFIKAIGRGKAGPLVNLSDGGEGPSGMTFAHTEETKARISASHLGVKLSDDHRRALSDSHRGKKLSAENRANISKSLTGRVVTAETRAKIGGAHRGKTKTCPPHNKGKKYGPLSAEHRAKIGASNIGKRTGQKMSAEARAKISAIQKGKKRGPRSEETKAKLSEIHRGRIITEEWREKLRTSHLGQIVTPETRAKISAAQKGVKRGPRTAPVSAETRAKLSAATKKYWDVRHGR